MNIFDHVKNESFFKPLTLKYRRIYYDCMQILIDRSRELPVLYESDAKDSITIYLKNLSLEETAAAASDAGQLTEEMNVPGGEIAEEAGPAVELQAPVILGLFRECGWISPREIGRNGEYVVTVSTDCRRIMDFLRKLTEKSGDGLMSNRIFSMYEIMKSAFDEESIRRERPYTNILEPLAENETELKNELTDLKDSISGIMKMVIAFQDVNSFGQFIKKDEMLDRFFGEYFFVKNNGLIPTQISYLRNRLRLLRQGELYERMIAECAAKRLISAEEAEECVERDFAELQYFLGVEYDENMELIDQRINTYYNLANTRILLMTSNGVRLESAISDFLNAVAGLEPEEQEKAMEKAADCMRIVHQQYVGSKSFARSRRLKNEGENIGLHADVLTEEEKRAQTEALFESAPNRYSVERVGSFVGAVLGDRKKISIRERKPATKEEVLMYTAAMLYAENEEFPYQVRWSDEIVETEAAAMSCVTISGKEKKRKG